VALELGAKDYVGLPCKRYYIKRKSESASPLNRNPPHLLARNGVSVFTSWHPQGGGWQMIARTPSHYHNSYQKQHYFAEDQTRWDGQQSCVD
jgi:hypothetical protein